MNRTSLFVFKNFLILLIVFTYLSCGGDTNSDKQPANKKNTSGLPDWEFENGFGP